MHRAALLVVAGLLAVAAFGPGLLGPFLLDDFGSVMKARPAEHSFEAWYDVATRDRAGPLRRPLANLSFALNHVVDPGRPLGFKLVNLALHGILAWLLFALGRRLVRACQPNWSERRIGLAAGFGALIWMLHPLQVSTVTYVVQRMAALAALFSAAALLVLVRFLQREDPSRRAFWLTAIAYWALVALALGSKETGALVPLMALATLLAIPGLAARARPFHSATVTHAALAPVLVGLVAALALLGHFIDAYALRDFTLAERLATQVTVLWFYLSLALWPEPKRLGLYHDGYPVFGPGDPVVWLAAAGLVALAAAAFALRRRAPLASLAILWFLAAHALESSIVPLEMVFEHRNYLALFGPALAAGAALSALGESNRRPVRALATLPVLTLVALTAVRSHAWSSEALFVATEARNRPDSPRALLAMAAFDLQRGRTDTALARVERIKALVPRRAWPWLLDAHVQCALAEHPVDWRRIDAVLGTPPIHPMDFGALEFLARRVLAGATDCPNLDTIPFDAAVARAVDANRGGRDAEIVEELLLIRAQIAQARGARETAAALMVAAADANPRGTDALFTLAYFELNAGRLDVTAAAIDRLRAVAAREGYAIGYQIRELEGFLADARARAAKAPGAGTG